MELLQINNIKKYYKKIKAVDDITFTVNKGDIIGLVGDNGAGKSTTLSMLSTLIKPDSGEILYKEQDIVKYPKSIRKELGYVPQEISLYTSLTALDNLKFWGKAQGLQKSVLKERIEIVSEIIGLKERLKDEVTNFSGGMKRRLNIGVALVHNPQLVIMDEPTVGIDTQSRKNILNTIKKLNDSGTTIIYTSHYFEEIEELCNRICILKDGKIKAIGDKEKTIAIYKELICKD